MLHTISHCDRLALALLFIAMGFVAGAHAGEGGHLYKVHDPDRPWPETVEPAGGCFIEAPSDAVVLFDGGDLSGWEQVDGKPAAWLANDGAMQVKPGSKDIRTREMFGDMQLHLEWMVPATEAKDQGQKRGNSGVFLMGRYEIQVLETQENRTYADGMAGAVYGQTPPMVNAGLGLGVWQSYDIFFHGPRFADDGSVLKPATVTALHNGVLIHDHTVFLGPTASKKRRPYVAHPTAEPLVLQHHGDPVFFRNIWARPLGESVESE